MKDFLKAAGKILVLKQDPNKPQVPRILRSLYYAGGKVYATDSAVMIWAAAPFEQQGAYDYETGEKYDLKLNVERVIPDTDESIVRLTLNKRGASMLLQALKPLPRLFDKGEFPVIAAYWSYRDLTVRAHSEAFDIAYQLPSHGAVSGPDEAVCTRLIADKLVIVLEYLLQASKDFTIYVSPKCPVLFQGDGVGAVLSYCKDPTE